MLVARVSNVPAGGRSCEDWRFDLNCLQASTRRGDKRNHGLPQRQWVDEAKVRPSWHQTCQQLLSRAVSPE
jgi:hypothetical protein